MAHRVRVPAAVRPHAHQHRVLNPHHQPQGDPSIMTALAHIQKGRTLMPRRVMLYGVHGVGKSTFGAMAETPVFITTEEGTNDI
ncbi:MAG: AAA family ATPase, partial [Phycisphaerales bacterium]|nr:AAA family ATPase [Phycisphaerales bacterium]